MVAKKKVAVIGSGFGGLAAAIRLQTSGYQVRIFEKRELPGGRAYRYNLQGYTFDAGPTVITAPECIEELFEISGRKVSDYVNLMHVKPFYRLLWEDGDTFDYSNDDTAMKRQLASRSNADLLGYYRFVEYSKAVYKEGYEKLVDYPFLTIWSMLKCAPQLIRLQAFRSVYSMVAKFIKNPHLRQAFSFHSLLVGGNPYKASSIYTLIHYLERKGGVLFPKGGTSALVDALVRLFTELGGEIVYNAEIDEIICEGNQVWGLRLSSGEREAFDLVVNNADVAVTYKHLLRNHPKAVRRAKSVSRKRFSMSLFLVYFGTKKQYPDVAHHSVIFGPRYKELLHDIFETGDLPSDFSLYLHRPTATDPDLAPEGCDAFYVLSPVAHLGKSTVNWDVEGERYAERILEYLETHYLPGLREHIEVKKIFTPNDFVGQLNAHMGSAFSLEPTLLQSAYFRIHNRDADVRGLYFVGAGTHPGAGVPGVINSAKATVRVIHQDFPATDKLTELPPVIASRRKEEAGV